MTPQQQKLRLACPKSPPSCLLPFFTDVRPPHSGTQPDLSGNILQRRHEGGTWNSYKCIQIISRCSLAKGPLLSVARFFTFARTLWWRILCLSLRFSPSFLICLEVPIAASWMRPVSPSAVGRSFCCHQLLPPLSRHFWRFPSSPSPSPRTADSAVAVLGLICNYSA